MREGNGLEGEMGVKEGEGEEVKGLVWLQSSDETWPEGEAEGEEYWGGTGERGGMGGDTSELLSTLGETSSL